jgi:hypothetical protein
MLSDSRIQKKPELYFVLPLYLFSWKSSLILLLFFASAHLGSQTLAKPPEVLWLVKKTPLNLIHKSDSVWTFQKRDSQKANTQFIFKHELPSAAVFCRLEEKIWKSWHIWLYIRAGSDELYREQTKSGPSHAE